MPIKNLLLLPELQKLSRKAPKQSPLSPSNGVATTHTSRRAKLFLWSSIFQNRCTLVLFCAKFPLTHISPSSHQLKVDQCSQMPKDISLARKHVNRRCLIFSAPTWHMGHWGCSRMCLSARVDFLDATPCKAFHMKFTLLGNSILQTSSKTGFQLVLPWPSILLIRSSHEMVSTG
jgi:hypothetical protein